MNSEMMGLKINLINSLFSLSSIPPYLKFNLGKDYFSRNFKSWLISIFMILNLNKLLKILTDAISYEYHFFNIIVIQTSIKFRNSCFFKIIKSYIYILIPFRFTHKIMYPETLSMIVKVSGYILSMRFKFFRRFRMYSE